MQSRECPGKKAMALKFLGRGGKCVEKKVTHPVSYCVILIWKPKKTLKGLDDAR
jgi:hypothetical protein